MSAESLEKKRVVFLVRAKNAKKRKRVRKLIKRQRLSPERERKVVSRLFFSRPQRYLMCSEKFVGGVFAGEHASLPSSMGVSKRRSPPWNSSQWMLSVPRRPGTSIVFQVVSNSAGLGINGCRRRNRPSSYQERRLFLRLWR